ncbi:MAG: heavy-metal-associated domain-containing protein [Gammaproteobacteria bacterium]|nr:heavy-metal-associated domain-containing protein [Gammaproteobacteria bacterium]
MMTYRANVVIHLDEYLEPWQIQELERKLSGESGVISACVSDRATHLMVVDFDSRAISSNQLLARVQREGVHAELVGL